MAQGGGPEFKPQYRKKKKKRSLLRSENTPNKPLSMNFHWVLLFSTPAVSFILNSSGPVHSLGNRNSSVPL
jgi:hypothetical protein